MLKNRNVTLCFMAAVAGVFPATIASVCFVGPLFSAEVLPTLPVGAMHPRQLSSEFAPTTATTQRTNPDEANLPIEIQAVYDLAWAAPPELGADVMLKLVERGYVASLSARKNILEKAWTLAATSKYPFELATAVPAGTDTDPESLRSALGTGLSAASLEMRVIAQMSQIDPLSARAKFLRMTPPAQESVDCSWDRYSSHRAYFRALGLIAGTFSNDEIKKGDRSRFLSTGIRSLASQQDFSVSLALLQADGLLTDPEFLELLEQWSRSLETAKFNDRVFSDQPFRRFSSSVIEAAKVLRSRGGSAESVLRALRSYFVRHASGRRCSDGRSLGGEEQARLEFNIAVSELAPGILTVGAEEIKPAIVSGMATVIDYLPKDENSKVWQIKLAFSDLRFGISERSVINSQNPRSSAALTLEQRSTPEWNEQALKFLSQLEGWSGTLGEGRKVFFQKSEWYGALIEVVPDGPRREAFLKSYLTFLISSPIKYESPQNGWSGSIG